MRDRFDAIDDKKLEGISNDLWFTAQCVTSRLEALHRGVSCQFLDMQVDGVVLLPYQH
jgi:hypothetical protein